MKLQWLLNHTSEAKKVIASVCSDETAADVRELKALIEKAVEVVLDLFREPLHELGIDVSAMRSVPSQEAEAIKARLEALEDEEN